MVREGRVFISALGTGKPAFGSNYYVQALEVGAQVTVGSSGTTVTVAAGHGFAAGDKYMKSLDSATYSGVSTVASVTSTTLTLDSALSVSDGDILINLGADTGSTSPNYDGNGVVIYSDMDYTTSVTDATVTADSNGRYVYYNPGFSIWELVRTGTTLIALYQDTDSELAPSSVNVKSFGARGDGTTDDAAAIQAAIDYVGSTVSGATGGEVFFPCGVYLIKSGIDLKQYVKLRGVNVSGINDIYATGTGSVITAHSTFSDTAMFSTIASSQWWGVELHSLCLNANGYAANAVVLNGTKEARLYDLVIQDTTESAVWLVRPSAGIGLETRMFNVQCQRCNTAVAASRRGVIHVEQTDCFIQNCRARGNDNTTYTNSGNICGFYFSGTGNFVSDSYADFCEDGFVVAVYGNQFVNCRADTNGGHGWVITSAVNSGTAVGCYAANNSQATTNTYDGFNCAASRFIFSGCQVVFNGVTNTHRYAFNQTSSFGADNRWIGCTAIPAAYGTKLFNDTNSAGGWEFQNAYLISAADDATPSVKNVRTLSVGGLNTGTTEITQLDDAAPMQTVCVTNVHNTNYSYILNGGNFTLTSGDWSPRYGDSIELFTFTGTAWFERSRSRQMIIKGAKGTASLTGSTEITAANLSLIDITNTSGSNTFTLTAPSNVDGKILVLRVAAITAGDLSLADSGNVSLSAAWTTPGVGDTLTLVASGVVWYEIARSNN